MSSSSIGRVAARLGAGVLLCADQVSAWDNSNKDCLSESKCQAGLVIFMLSVAAIGLYRVRRPIGSAMRWFANHCPIGYEDFANMNLDPALVYVPPNAGDVVIPMPQQNRL